MAAPDAMTGIESGLYVRTAGNWASPTWTELVDVGDCTQNAAWKTAEVEVRSSPATMAVKTTIDIGVSFKMLGRRETGNAAYNTVIAALGTRDVVDVMILNGSNTTNGSRGWRYEGQVTSGTEDQGTQAVIMPDLEIKPTVTNNVPASVVVSAGAPVFTSLT
jgi:hypothetical protein